MAGMQLKFLKARRQIQRPLSPLTTLVWKQNQWKLKRNFHKPTQSHRRVRRLKNCQDRSVLFAVSGYSSGRGSFTVPLPKMWSVLNVQKLSSKSCLLSASEKIPVSFVLDLRTGRRRRIPSENMKAAHNIVRHWWSGNHSSRYKPSYRSTQFWNGTNKYPGRKALIVAVTSLMFWQRKD